MLIFCGIQPGSSGVGRVMSFLSKEADRFRSNREIRLFFGTTGSPSIKSLLIRKRIFDATKTLLTRVIRKHTLKRTLTNQLALEAKSVILIHPQTLGFEWCINFIRKRIHPTWIYVMDSSFFCVQSYNHVNGETKPCVRCLGGNTQSAIQLGCRPFPVVDPWALTYIQELKTLATQGKVRFLAQNEKQSELITKQFGSDTIVRIVGLWATDWDNINNVSRSTAKVNQNEATFDVVFHGAPVEAKGVEWSIELARECPELSFLFPFNKTSLSSSNLATLPSNCQFKEMTWEDGLDKAIAKAAITLVPSLWSAPIEGAFVKSMMLGRAVAIVDNVDAYPSEIPHGLTLKLPVDTKKAAHILSSSIMSNWQPDPEQLREWIDCFSERNRGLIDNISAHTNEQH